LKAEFNAAVEAEQAQRAEKDRAGTEAARERLTPAEERRARLIDHHQRTAARRLIAALIANIIARAAGADAQTNNRFRCMPCGRRVDYRCTCRRR
jgi:hypothetical protein